MPFVLWMLSITKAVPLACHISQSESLDIVLKCFVCLFDPGSLPIMGCLSRHKPVSLQFNIFHAICFIFSDKALALVQKHGSISENFEQNQVQQSNVQYCIRVSKQTDGAETEKD